MRGERSRLADYASRSCGGRRQPRGRETEVAEDVTSGTSPQLRLERSPGRTSPEQARLERVPNPHPDKQYVSRFTAPEFTSLCPGDRPA